MTPLVGQSIVFAKSNDEWATKRKRLSSSFYKDKLIKMFDIINTTVNKKLHSWQINFEGQEKDFDLISEMSSLMSSIIFTCTYGKDLGNEPVEITENGQPKTVTLIQLIDMLVGNLFLRGMSVKVLLYQRSAKYYTSSFDKE